MGGGGGGGVGGGGGGDSSYSFKYSFIMAHDTIHLHLEECRGSIREERED